MSALYLYTYYVECAWSSKFDDKMQFSPEPFPWCIRMPAACGLRPTSVPSDRGRPRPRWSSSPCWSADGSSGLQSSSSCTRKWELTKKILSYILHLFFFWCRDSVVLRLFFLNRGIWLFTVLQNMPLVFKTNYWPTESFRIFSYKIINQNWHQQRFKMFLMKFQYQNYKKERLKMSPENLKIKITHTKERIKNVSYKISKSEMFSPPLSMRPRLRDGPLQLLVPHDGLALRVHQQHTARTKTTLLDNVAGFDIVNADLGGHHHHVVLRDVVSEMQEI